MSDRACKSAYWLYVVGALKVVQAGSATAELNMAFTGPS